MLVKVTEAILVMEYIDAQPLERGLPADLPDVIKRSPTPRRAWVPCTTGLGALRH